MGKLFFFFILLVAVYILWDRGAFGNRRGDVGPAQKLGATIDRGMEKAGQAVEHVGEKLQAAAAASPHPTPTPIE